MLAATESKYGDIDLLVGLYLGPELEQGSAASDGEGLRPDTKGLVQIQREAQVTHGVEAEIQPVADGSRSIDGGHRVARRSGALLNGALESRLVVRKVLRITQDLHRHKLP